MIYTPRSESTNQTRTVVKFRGYEISIAMDDRSRGGNTPLTRSSLIVYKDDEEVTYKFAGCHNTNNGAIEEVEGETLFEVMLAIAAVTKPDSSVINDILRDFVKTFDAQHGQA